MKISRFIKFLSPIKDTISVQSENCFLWKLFFFIVKTWYKTIDLVLYECFKEEQIGDYLKKAR